jgi:hypothetical protein
MRNTTYPTASSWEITDGNVAFAYGGCKHNLNHFGKWATATAIWACSGFPKDWGYEVTHEEIDFGGWVCEMHIRLPDGSTAVTK